MPNNQTSGLSGNKWKTWIIGRRPGRTLLRASLMLAGSLCLFKFILIPIQVSGVSMFPTCMDGSINFVNRLSFVFGAPPHRGDIVAIHDQEKGVVLLKRIIAQPGERLAIVNGQVLINGQPLDEHAYLKARQPWNEEERTLGPDQYFVIGDNRTMIQSLHRHGQFTRNELIGRVLLKKGLSPSISHLSELSETASAESGVVAMR
jgi:signal peptidase I